MPRAAAPEAAGFKENKHCLRHLHHIVGELVCIPSVLIVAPVGIYTSQHVMGGGNSLDNTLRVARLVPTEWVLLDIRIHAVANGFAHGLVHEWAEDGTLLATASQSTIVRFWKD